jgi:hypothetical protein
MVSRFAGEVSQLSDLATLQAYLDLPFFVQTSEQLKMFGRVGENLAALARECLSNPHYRSEECVVRIASALGASLRLQVQGRAETSARAALLQDLPRYCDTTRVRVAVARNLTS